MTSEHQIDPIRVAQKADQDDRFLEAKPRRRQFSDSYKRQVLNELDDHRGERGAIGAILRREGLYASQVAGWRREYELIASGEVPNRRPGRPNTGKMAQAELERLQKKCARLEEQLRQAHVVIDIQKKIAALIQAESNGEI